MPPKSAAPGVTSNNDKKRKRGDAADAHNPKKARFMNVQNARAISRQTTDAAFANGELNVDKFVRAREYEIKALEAGLKSSKDALSTRAFQEVPRDLRRRTASHNVRRVPKRLRRRAAREMKEDNTPTVQSRRRKPTPHQRLRLETAKKLQILSDKSRKRKLEKRKQAKEHDVSTTEAPKYPEEDSSKATVKPKKKVKAKLRAPPEPRAKYRKRQIGKTWLPTHLYHAKRAHMTPPKEALWRFSIPLSPNNKVYRTTHRASTLRSAVAWDTSYTSTIGLKGTQVSILGLLAAIGLDLEGEKGPFWTAQHRKWLSGSRTRTAWVYERDVLPRRYIAPITVLWNPPNPKETARSEASTAAKPVESKQEQREVLIRVHVAAFLEVWEQVTRLAKVQKPSIAVEDLRFDIGSIEITGPNALEALTGVLSLVEDDVNDTMASTWRSLRQAGSSAAAPQDVMLAFETADPRLQGPVHRDKPGSEEALQESLQLLATWPLDKEVRPASIFDRNARLSAQRSIPNQRSINKRNSAAKPDSAPEVRPADPKIPILLFNSKTSALNQATWTLLLPWKCVEVIWRCLMHKPLSCGGQVRFGGLDQKRQLNFEAGIPWFPGDCPGTKAGDLWELQQRDQLEKKWKAHPKSRRTEYSTIDLGMKRIGEIGEGWSCDWERLLQIHSTSLGGSKEPQPSDNTADGPEVQDATMTEVEANKSSAPNLVPRYVPYDVALRALRRKDTAEDRESTQTGLATMKISMITRGVPQARARIYRLPTNNATLRSEWLALLDATTQPAIKRSTKSIRPLSAATADPRARLAAMLLKDGSDKPGAQGYPCVPDEVDLIGFITTGNFNLGQGLGTGIGSIILKAVLMEDGEDATMADGTQRSKSSARENKICIVRDSGQTVGRLARWELA